MEAKEHGARTLAIVNVVGSAIAKAADDVIYTWAGPEIAVATTKAFTTQLCVIYLIALYIADLLGTIKLGFCTIYIGFFESFRRLNGGLRVMKRAAYWTRLVLFKLACKQPCACAAYVECIVEMIIFCLKLVFL